MHHDDLMVVSNILTAPNLHRAACAYQPPLFSNWGIFKYFLFSDSACEKFKRHFGFFTWRVGEKPHTMITYGSSSEITISRRGIGYYVGIMPRRQFGLLANRQFGLLASPCCATHDARRFGLPPKRQFVPLPKTSIVRLPERLSLHHHL